MFIVLLSAGVSIIRLSQVTIMTCVFCRLSHESMLLSRGGGGGVISWFKQIFFYGSEQISNTMGVQLGKFTVYSHKVHCELFKFRDTLIKCT